MNVTPPTVLMVGLAALSTFMLGGLWYSPALFGRAWQRWAGLDEAHLQSTMGRTFAVAGAAAVIFAVNLGFFVGGASTLAFGAFAGLATGIFMACAIVTSYVFARRPWAFIAVDAGYHVVAATLAGMIIGALGSAPA